MVLLICSILKHSMFLMRNANVNFARTFAVIFMKDIARRWPKYHEINFSVRQSHFFTDRQNWLGDRVGRTSNPWCSSCTVSFLPAACVMVFRRVEFFFFSSSLGTFRTFSILKACYLKNMCLQISYIDFSKFSKTIENFWKFQIFKNS